MEIQYQTDQHLKKWFKKIIALSLIPPSKVADVFEELLVEMHESFDLHGDYKNLERFADYVLINYIGDTTQPLFPIHLWNQYENDERTNNDGEAYSHRVNNYFGTHPNIWKFIRKLKEESSTYLHYMRINNGTMRRRGRNRKDIEKDDKINKCKIRFLLDQITSQEYLEEISN